MKALFSVALTLSFACCFLAAFMAATGPFHVILPIASLFGLFGVFYSAIQLSGD